MTGVPDDAARVGQGYDRSAPDYDELLDHNREGAERLVAALPEGRWDRVLDVGCGTGFASRAFVRRFGACDLTGVDVSAEMLARYAESLGAEPGVRVTVHRADATAMPVPDASFDAVISSMAFHWFPKKPEAVAVMARAARPGGIVAILASGRGSDAEFRMLLEGIEPPVPQVWLATFDLVQRDEAEMEGYLKSAGLEIADLWMERRRRRTPGERYLARMTATAGHVSAGLDEAELAALGERVRAALARASGPGGFAYTFNKLYAVARRPL